MVLGTGPFTQKHNYGKGAYHCCEIGKPTTAWPLRSIPLATQENIVG